VCTATRRGSSTATKRGEVNNWTRCVEQAVRAAWWVGGVGGVGVECADDTDGGTGQWGEAAARVEE
jgi:hypothetical protein